MFTHLQDNFGQLMPYKIFKREDIVKKTIYNPWDPIATVFYYVEEILYFSDITGTLYTQYQDVNLAYVIINRMGKFRLTIREWNHTTKVQRTWVRFKQRFWTLHRELQETSNLTVEEYSMYHTNMVRDVVAGLQ